MSLTRAIGVVLATAACGPPQEDGDAAPASVRVDPASVYFGLVEWGSTATQEITISNDGGEAADVTGLGVSTDDFVVDDGGPFTIEPRSAVKRTLEWTPATIDGLDAHLEVLGEDGPHTRVAVTGGTSYAVLDVLENEGADFGGVPVGCQRVAHIVLANDGLIDLVVSSMPDITHAEFTIRDSSGNSLETPVSIPPRSSEIIDIEFAPTAVHAIDSTLEMTTNDPFAPTVQVEVRGEGVWNEEHALEWTIGRYPQTTLIHVNQSVLSAPWAGGFVEFLPAFFDALLAAAVPFRVAFTQDVAGHVEGSIPYIDDSFTASEAVDAAEGMLPHDSGDNDAGMESCLQGLETNAAWIFDDAAQPQSRLNVVSINTDNEQSPGDGRYYVQRFEDAWGTSNLGVHGIAGDVPHGCLNGAAVAVASWSLYDATVESGGVFISICDADWTATAFALAAACTGFERFLFSETPLAESIHVYVDGVEALAGWWYDATTNELVFDEMARPLDGAHVRAVYLLAESCE